MTDWGNVTFIAYLDEIDNVLERRYGVTSSDSDMDEIAAAQEGGDSPADYAAFYANQHGLADLSANLSPEGKTQRIRELNDQLRRSVGIPRFGAIRDKILLTRGIAALSPIEQLYIMAKVRDFADFEEGNDPYGEHDFGSFAHNGQTIFWKIDYYASDMEHGSEAPENPEQTVRVLTVLLAEEY